MGPQGRVLVVDDEPAIRALIAKIVERAGLPVDSARDGADAIAKMEERRYSVIVVDLMMPNVDGYELIRRLRSRPGPAIPVILITAVPQTRLPPGLTYEAYLDKPVDQDKLARTVARLADEGRAFSQD